MQAHLLKNKTPIQSSLNPKKNPKRKLGIFFCALQNQMICTVVYKCIKTTLHNENQQTQHLFRIDSRFYLGK
jgi:hypothetical protein